jgi:DNA-binding SARP family transcriptional activator
METARISGSADLPFQIYLLGGFEVVKGDHRLREADWSRRKAVSLFQRLPKEQAIDFLWPESTAAAGANNLYRTLYALRQTINDSFGPNAADAIISFSDGHLALDKSVWVDVREFERAVNNRKTGIPDLQKAIDLYKGDLLPDDPYSDWLIIRRNSLRQRYRETSITLADYYRKQQKFESAIQHLIPLVNYDPIDEPIHRELMVLYALEGRRHAAVRQYQAVEDALASELDLSPEPATNRLYEMILSGELSQELKVNLDPTTGPGGKRWELPIALQTQISNPLLGRDLDLEILQDYLKAGNEGEGRTILIAGESGMGKTRLAAETLMSAAESGMIPMFGAAYEQEGSLAFQPFIEAIDDFLKRHNTRLGIETNNERRMSNPITGFRRDSSGDPEQQSWALFNAVAEFLRRLGSGELTAKDGERVVLLLDDLHAADESTLHLFHYLARQRRTSPLILIATYRTDVKSTTSSFGMLLNALYRERLSEIYTLSPLDSEAVGQMLSHLLSHEPDASLVSAVCTITEGNPFFIEEIGHTIIGHETNGKIGYQLLLTKGSSNDVVALRVPSGLRDLLLARVIQLGKQVERVLTTAAVIGRDFEYEILQGAVDKLTWTSDQSDRSLVDALDEALSAHLVNETATGYRFHHPLIRQTLYESISQVRRARLHTRVAESIESAAPRHNKKPEDYAEELAYHYDHSDRRERALDYLIRSGRKAAKIYAYEIAVDYFERALSLLDALDLSESQRRFRLLERIGRYHKILADTPKAVSAFEEALEITGPDWKPPPGDRARLRRLAALTLLTAGHLEEAGQYLQDARAELEDADKKGLELANVLYNTAQVHWHHNEYHKAFNVAQQSLAIAERLNDPAATARSFEMLALACHSLGEWQQGLGFEEQRLALTGPGLEVSEAFDVHL